MLKAEIEKAQKTLAAAQGLDITGEGEVSDEVREAQLRVDALVAAAQAAHHDAAAAEQRAQAAAQAALEEAREAHAKEREELMTQLATLTVKDEPGSMENVRWASQRGQSGEQNRVLASRKNASSASQQMHFFDLIGSCHLLPNELSNEEKCICLPGQSSKRLRTD